MNTENDMAVFLQKVKKEPELHKLGIPQNSNLHFYVTKDSNKNPRCRLCRDL